MKLTVSSKINKPAGFIASVWYIIPYIRLGYNPACFLETGVNTRALIFEVGWGKWGWTLIIQEAY
jgi:hypothetical protein